MPEPKKMSKPEKCALSNKRTAEFVAQMAAHRQKPATTPPPRGISKPKRKYGW